MCRRLIAGSLLHRPMTNKAEHLYPIYVRQGRSPKSYKAGFIDADGKIVIPPSFEDAASFSEGLVSGKINRRWGAIDASGKLVIPLILFAIARKITSWIFIVRSTAACG
jgi:hypothetical protein